MRNSFLEVHHSAGQLNRPARNLVAMWLCVLCMTKHGGSAYVEKRMFEIVGRSLHRPIRKVSEVISDIRRVPRF